MNGIRGNIGATSIADNTRENRLKWLGHVLRRGKPKKEEVQSDIKRVSVSVVDAGD